MEQAESVILQEIIKPGKQFFNNFLLQQINNKKIDKRKKANKANQNNALNNINQSYSVYNLVRPTKPQLSSSNILAGQLLKTNIFNEKRSQNQEGQQSIKFYEDYQKSQKINRRFMKILLKPTKDVKNNQNQLQKKSVSFQQTFNLRFKELIDKESTQVVLKIQEKYFPKEKLTTTLSMLDQSDQKMLYFSSDAKRLLKKVQFQIQVQNYSSEFFNGSIESLKNQLQYNGVQCCKDIYNTEMFGKFSSLFSQALPYYLHTSYHQNFSPLPWKSGFLQKEIQKAKFPLITGKVLYKYQHNLILQKENHIKSKIYSLGNKTYDNLKNFIEQKISEKRIKNTKKQKLLQRERQQNSQKNQNYQKIPFNKRQILPKNQDFQKQEVINSDNSKQKDFVSKNLISINYGPQKVNQPKIIQPSYPSNNPQFQKNSGYNYRSLNNVISMNIRNNPPPSGSNINEQSLNQFKFSKNSYFAQHQNQSLQQDKRKISSLPKNIYIFNQNQLVNSFEKDKNQSYFRSKYDKEQFNQKSFDRNLIFAQVKQNPQKNQSKSVKSLSDSNSSDCWNQIRKFQQGKTTKKKKSFIANKSPRPSENHIMKIIKSQNKKLMSKKDLDISFYPLKLGNLILQRSQKTYIQYNCQKQEPKNLPMKFLLDCKKHGVRKVSLVIPSLKQSNNLKMKIKDQQKAKQIIKIILSLGGEIQRLKPQSEYNEQSRKDHLKVSAELQIYKFYYQDLSYFDIIDSLNIEKEWLQKQSEKIETKGYKY